MGLIVARSLLPYWDLTYCSVDTILANILSSIPSLTRGMDANISVQPLQPPKPREVGLTSLCPLSKKKPPRGPDQGILSGDPVVYPYREKNRLLGQRALRDWHSIPAESGLFDVISLPLSSDALQENEVRSAPVRHAEL
ncbi:hypothetical protein FALCPG4_19037 [Fusarium falciforme]